MTVPTSGGAVPGGSRSTWVVLCPGDDGRPRSEYVEGTEVVADRAGGVLRILDGGQVVREYAVGAWSNFCEWVSAHTDYFASSAIRLTSVAEPPEPSDAERLLAAAMRMDTASALTMWDAARAHGKTSEPDGVVRAPARLPGSRHA